MDARHVPVVLLTNPVNIRYLTGFAGSAGALLMGARQGMLWVDPRYTLQAQEQAIGAEVIEEKKGILKGVASWLGKNRVRECAFEASNLTCEQFEQVSKHAGSMLRLKAAGDLVEELRVVKDGVEIDAIRRAGKLTVEVLAEVLPHVRPGVKEQDLAAEIEYRMRKKGAEGAAFETIVASGPRSAHPHARPSSKALQETELVIFDLGAILGGYAADMTRTVFLGKPSSRVRKLYSAVLKAQDEAVRTVRGGIKAGKIDSVARHVLAKQGVAQYFTHSTGHGVGLEIHERPRLGKGETTCLRAGSVVTVEPGVYLQGVGGIRIEDTVLVFPDGHEVLTPAPKESWIIS
jgi:Xaa-Pro aminopeptidase